MQNFSLQYELELTQTCLDSSLKAHHDFAQLVAFGPDVIHQHFIRSQLVLDGQRVVLPLLHFLQLHSISQGPHHLDPASGLGQSEGKVKLHCISLSISLGNQHCYDMI